MEGLMKHKNILLTVFFLTLFISQPARADATIPPVKTAPQINGAPANTNILYPFVYVYVYKLVDGIG